MEIAADGLQLADELPRARVVELAVDTRAQLAKTLQRLGRIYVRGMRLEHLRRILARLLEVPRTAHHRHRGHGNADARRKLRVAHALDRLDREPLDPRQVVP